MAEANDKSLEKIHDAFHHMLAEATEHPFRDILPEALRKLKLLNYLETLPYVACDLLLDDVKGVVKGWLLHSALLFTFVTACYNTTSTET